MGCISSKIITRSRSYHEEYLINNQSFHQKRDNTRLEEVFISRNGTGRDQFLAHLVCSAAAAANTSTTVTLKKLQSRKFSSSEQPPSNKDVMLKPSVIPMNPETINSWELMTGLEEEQQQQQQQQKQQHQQQQQNILLSPRGELEPIHHHRLLTKKRSKSFHWFIEHDLSSSILEGSCAKAEDHPGSNNNNNKKMGILRSRSFHFHTLQEYDEMVAVERKNWLIEALEQGNPEDPDRDMMMRKAQNSYANCGTYSSSSKTCDHSVDDDEVADRVLEIIDGKDNKYYGLMEEDANKKDSRWIEEEEEEDQALASLEAANYKSKNAEIIEAKEKDAVATYSSSSISAPDVVEGDVHSKGKLLTSEKGLRRKALAKELTSLTIPMLLPPSSSSSSIEFPRSLRECRHDHDEVLGAQQQEYSFYSSEAYVTPKFGSFYSLPPVPVQSKKCGSSSSSTDDYAVVFESEMVAAFEEAMQQLQVEEDCVLKKIGENLDQEDHGTQPPGGDKILLSTTISGKLDCGDP